MNGEDAPLEMMYLPEKGKYPGFGSRAQRRHQNAVARRQMKKRKKAGIGE